MNTQVNMEVRMAATMDIQLRNSQALARILPKLDLAAHNKIGSPKLRWQLTNTSDIKLAVEVNK